ncbi:YaaC family protein [Bradyrhizobium sp. AZCC 2262]|uniref:YaaC family protein n=1 Tax=Bradyrhizobium sp. AZCC 2262 TaxID=3117022 RepID=UPI003FA5C5EE
MPRRYYDDVRKQALQIRYCLLQAREYFTAAASVSLATKPNLLYYGTMSLAFAEILFKQSGDSSLDRAREQNKHHGLTMTAIGSPKTSPLRESSRLLKAYPMEIMGVRKGTFELWHRTAREHPIPGEMTRYFQDEASTTTFECLWGAEDKQYKPVPSTGISLEDCLNGLPLLSEHLESAGLTPHFVRGKCLGRLWPGPQWNLNNIFIIHPDPKVRSLLERLKVNPNLVDRIDLREAGTGIVVTLTSDSVNGHASFPVPGAAMINTAEWRMWTNDPPLNEFGFYYVGLYLAGNYARYYPDKWLADVEASSPISLAIEEMCSTAEWRAPWLTLCELDRKLFVNEA